jgi:hypothetical protein
MIRELIQQIELQKLAEQDPEAFLDEITKLAFFDELEQIKEAGAGRELLKRTVGLFTGKGAGAAERAAATQAKTPRASWTANLQKTPDPAAVQARKFHAAGEATQQASRQRQLAFAS